MQTDTASFALATALMQCSDNKCHLCVSCLTAIRHILGLTETGWAKTNTPYDPGGELGQILARRRLAKGGKP